MEKTTYTKATRKALTAILLVAVLFTSNVARPVNTTTATRTAATTTEGIQA